MAVEVQAQGEPRPAKIEVTENLVTVDNIAPGSPPPSTEELVEMTRKQLEVIVSRYENNVIDANRAEELRRDVHELAYAGAVSVSVVDGTATVEVRALIRGLEVWFKTEFAAKAANDAAGDGEEQRDPLGPHSPAARRLGGKGASGDAKKSATAPYAEVADGTTDGS